MKEEMKIISPIAIDMGAKNTGVYYAKYQEGSSFKGIEKQGQVLVYNKYTALLGDRTANRHARRGYQRKKLAKRLLVLVLENYFKFPAKQHTQAIGFLLNRRGFTFLDEQYSKDHLTNLPDKTWNELSDDVQNILGKQESVVSSIEKFISNDPEKIKEIFNAIQDIESYKNFQEKKEKIKKEFVYLDYIEKINKACEIIIKNEEVTNEKVAKNKTDKKKLSETSNWIVERLNKENNLGLVIGETNQTNLIEQITASNAQQLKKQLPDFIEKRNKVENKKKENNQSDWNFNITKFEFNDKNEMGLDELNTKTHLHHFCYAIYKINNEIVSGARHRSKYFEEIKADLEKFVSDDFLENKHAPKYLKEFAKEIKNNKWLGTDKLGRLVCHISNFELKPLRAYFNDRTPIAKDGKKISHKKGNGGDKFSLEKLSRLASIWFLKNWRVNKEKDGQEKVDQYKGRKGLKELWKNHGDKNDIVAFWLNTCPIWTIPPYQSMNNRRPPKCQTLLLNGEYLNKHYPQWKTWLDDRLELNQDYKEKLKSLKSGKGGGLISDNLIQLRQLQFILDTAKKRDKYKLNEIWSIHHKLQQLKDSDDTEEIDECRGRLNKAKTGSNLPEELKNDLDFGKEKSFGHFINKYYQTRKKAKEGRYFLHQIKKDKWITDDKLLTVCTHKPRQKPHQWTIDLAAVLGIDSGILKRKIGCKLEDADDFFDKEFSNNYKINDFQSACDKAAKAQKDYRGSLKTKIDLAQKPKEEYKDKLNNKEQKELFGLARKCEKLSLQLAEKLWQDLSEDERKKKADKFKSVFSFAQINNIVFKERSGFSKTCPVCSTDNGFRMQENNKGIANASRLPAMSIRLIDGVVMRICDAVSRQIATTCWDGIKGDLENGEEVRVPLIFEQNRFEFEPSLKVIKKKLKEEGAGDSKETLVNKSEDEKDKQYGDKYQRIKDIAQGICAYEGTSLGNNGEIDHIIPQASKYGTLNDEANLIYVSNLGNQDKGKQTKFLGDLSDKYKNTIFKGKTNNEIELFIYQQLEGQDATIGVVENEDYFEFGRYLSFINLSPEQQIAFRHALFLPDDDPLKQKVINALQNRNRTIVNGTQRYMAQCIADKLYKIARKSGKEKQIKFDYFEYTARADDSKSTYNLRRLYGISKPKKQPLYSHLIDAQLAFLIASEDHQNDGSMGLKFEKDQTIWENKKQEKINKETGEISLNVLPSELFEDSAIGENNFSAVDLSRKKSETGVRLHRSFHRSNFYAENYVPLFLGKKGETIKVKAGFSWENSADIKMNSKNRINIFSILKFANDENISTWNSDNKSLEYLYDDFDKKIRCGDFEVFYIDWDKTKIQKYLVDKFSNKSIAEGKIWSDEICFLRELSYRTQKEKIKNSQAIDDVLNKKNYFDIKIFGETIELPAKKEWKLLLLEWNKFEGEFNDFLKDYFKCEKGFKESNKKSQENKHQKVRKVFSLPVVNRLGNFLQKRKSWNDRDIYQISADSESREDGNKFSRLVSTQDGELRKVINKPFISKNAFKLKQENILENSEIYRNIDPYKWYGINCENNKFPSGVHKIEYCIDNTTRPQIRIYLSEELTAHDIQQILKNNLTKARESNALKEKLESDDAHRFLEYTASRFNQDIKMCLLKAMKG